MFMTCWLSTVALSLLSPDFHVTSLLSSCDRDWLLNHQSLAVMAEPFYIWSSKAVGWDNRKTAGVCITKVGRFGCQITWAGMRRVILWHSKSEGLFSTIHGIWKVFKRSKVEVKVWRALNWLGLQCSLLVLFCYSPLCWAPNIDVESWGYWGYCFFLQLGILKQNWIKFLCYSFDWLVSWSYWRGSSFMLFV